VYVHLASALTVALSLLFRALRTLLGFWFTVGCHRWLYVRTAELPVEVMTRDGGFHADGFPTLQLRFKCWPGRTGERSRRTDPAKLLYTVIYCAIVLRRRSGVLGKNLK